MVHNIASSSIAAFYFAWKPIFRLSLIAGNEP